MTFAAPRFVRYVADASRLPLPGTLNWLTVAERTELDFWKNSIRRTQWLAGRWLAKRMISRSVTISQLSRIEILSRDANGLGTRPRIAIDGNRQHASLSISHAGQSILVGWSRSGVRIGVDLAVDVPQNKTFHTAWFSASERDWIDVQPKQRTPIIWGLKEAIFKACGDNHKWNPAAVTVDSFDHNLVRAALRGKRLPRFSTWIRSNHNGTAAVVWQTQDNTEVALCS